MQNELPEWCPQWAWDEARRLASQVVAERGTRMEAFQPIVARAHVAAERRGIERAAKVAGQRAEMRERLFDENGGIISASKSIEAEEIAAAIRQLGGEG